MNSSMLDYLWQFYLINEVILINYTILAAAIGLQISKAYAFVYF